MPLSTSILSEQIGQCGVATLTVREIIRRRVREEVERFNGAQAERFPGPGSARGERADAQRRPGARAAGLGAAV